MYPECRDPVRISELANEEFHALANRDQFAFWGAGRDLRARRSAIAILVWHRRNPTISVMREGYRVMDSDLHVIEGAAVFEDYLDERWRSVGPTYRGWGPTGFPWWTVACAEGDRSIPPWAGSSQVAL